MLHTRQILLSIFLGTGAPLAGAVFTATPAQDRAATSTKPSSKPASKPASAGLKEGDAAPDFKVNDHTGRSRSLASMKGQRVILWFYPKAETPGCTAEGCAIRDNYKDFEKYKVNIFGVSFDTEKENAAFVKNQEFPFALLCDTEKKLGAAYGVWSEGRAPYASRHTYVIGPDGNIEKIYRKVNPATHAKELLDFLASTQKPK